MPLSASDQRVLGALFDAESSLQTSPLISFEIFNTSGLTAEVRKDLQGRETSAIRPINSSKTAKLQLEHAVTALTSLIMEYPNYASTYNNRAQAVRMLVGDTLNSPAVSCSSLYSNLCRAIQLASPISNDDPLSPLQAKTLASAYTHRGTLLLKTSRAGATQCSEGVLPQELKGLHLGMLEKMAERDLYMGARLGNQIAKNMSVQLNPYAKLCGETFKAALLANIKESMLSTTSMLEK